MIGQTRSKILIAEALGTILESINGDPNYAAKPAQHLADCRTVLLKVESENTLSGRKDYLIVYVAVSDSGEAISGVADQLAPLV